jgi:3'-5' exoribonuclease
LGACGRFRQVVCDVIGPVRDKFFYWPASVSGKHQTHEQGLLKHTVQVGEQVFHLADAYGVDVALSVAAALLHDVGKTQEYRKMQIDTWERSEIGQKVGHVSISHSMVAKICTDVDLQHCVLAHHGRFEWGSPKEPRTQEAWLVHLVDMISSRVGGNPIRPNYPSISV